MDLTTRTDYKSGTSTFTSPNKDEEDSIVGDNLDIEERLSGEVTSSLNQSQINTSSISKISNIDYQYLDRSRRIFDFVSKFSGVCPVLEKNGFDIEDIEKEQRANKKLISLSKNLLFMSNAVKESFECLRSGNIRGAEYCISKERLGGAQDAVDRVKRQIKC